METTLLCTCSGERKPVSTLRWIESEEEKHPLSVSFVPRTMIDRCTDVPIDSFTRIDVSRGLSFRQSICSASLAGESRVQNSNHQTLGSPETRRDCHEDERDHFPQWILTPSVALFRFLNIVSLPVVIVKRNRNPRRSCPWKVTQSTTPNQTMVNPIEQRRNERDRRL